MPITIWRRHVPTCPHKEKGRDYLKCSCPIWADGYVNGKREFRKSLGTRDMARARKKAMALEDPDRMESKRVDEVISLFLQHCKTHGTKDSSISKYKTTLNFFGKYCEQNGYTAMAHLTVVAVDDYLAWRHGAPNTTKNELRLLRALFKFSKARKWVVDNPAQEIPFPKASVSEVVPYTKTDLESILAACSKIGHSEYERLRARAMILVMRYTALRIHDVALLSRDRISFDGTKWRIFLRTTKKGKPVYLPVPAEMKDALDKVPAKRVGSKYYFWTEESSHATMVGIANRVMRSVFRRSGVPQAHSHRFRHTLATELMGKGANCDQVADVLGNTAEMVKKYYGQWSQERQDNIDALMEKVHDEATYTPAKLVRFK